MIKKEMRSGFQRKYLKYTLALLLLALLLSSVGVAAYVKRNMTAAVIDKYGFVTEKMGLSLDNLYRKSDEVTAECILNDSVQDSLKGKPLGDLARNTLSKYFAYLDLEQMADYCYVDNKENMYTRSYSRVFYEDFAKSDFSDYLGDAYSKTTWFWTEDTLFGTGEEALFIGRYVRSMEYAHEPGMLFFKMSPAYLRQGVFEETDISDGCMAGILDREGNLVLSREPEEGALSGQALEDICSAVCENPQEKLRNQKLSGGILSAYRQEESGFTVFTFVPDRVVNGSVSQIFLVLAAIYLLVGAVAVALSLYFSERITKPIQVINEAMTGFDGRDFDRTVELSTNTELDQIGQSYNAMVGNIRRLLEEIKEQEKELRTSEMNMLISQINPHFLYNTLDTIYMLARINKEETTMRMIQALSKYLRLSLSKGSDIVTLEDELENVKSYMEIIQIRNESLFQYEIDCRVEPSGTRIIKLILQPLVENAIKYGFCDIFEGGQIRIEVYREEAELVLCVYNNGTPMKQDTADRLNSLMRVSIGQMRELFEEDKKHGYGVVNIATRLRLKYGEGVQFYYEVQADGTKCVIRVPVKGEDGYE